VAPVLETVTAADARQQVARRGNVHISALFRRMPSFAVGEGEATIALAPFGAEMGDPTSGAGPRVGTAPEDRLNSWKEIAAYLRRDVTTAQRWEKREGMPVHRHVHDKLGSVYAFRSELDQWARRRNLSPAADGVAAGGRPPNGTDESSVQDAPAPPVAPVRERARYSRVAWIVGGAAFLAMLIAVWWRLDRGEYFWRDPLEGAHYQSLTDLAGADRAAAISRDGKFVAFLSDRNGRMDVWVTQIGAGQFYNLTAGRFAELVNPSIRTLGFSPDGTLVTFWVRGEGPSKDGDIAVWAAPTLGGNPRPYLEGAAELDWSRDGSQIVFHTPAAGDPMFVRDTVRPADTRSIFAAAAGLHAHFPVWSADDAYIYFVQGALPDAMDIWRIKPRGGTPEQITRHNSAVSYPVVLDRRTLLYLASDKDGSGPWLHTIDVEHRVPHRINAGVDRYTSLGASADGTQVVATVASSKRTLWRMSIADTPGDRASFATPVSLTTARGSSPRLGPGFLLYVSSSGPSDAIWKIADGTSTQLWSAAGAKVIGGPEIAPDGRRVAFSVEQRGGTALHVMDVDGTNARIVTGALALRGAPAWTADSASLASAAIVNGIPQLFRISLEGTTVPLVQEYAVDPVWSPGGDFVVYSGPDIGTTFHLNAADAGGGPHSIPNLTLTRGARRVRFLHTRPALVIMRGDIHHRDLWLIDLQSGAERQLTYLPADFDVRDFDISPDDRELIVERVEERSGIVLINR
jgi:Tol biopolymer transport system component